MSKLNKIIIGSGLLLVAVFINAKFLVAQPANAATPKVCTGHKDANCAAGASFNGKVICGDGTTSAVDYTTFCKAPALKCPIVLAKEDYDKQVKALQDEIEAVKSANQKLCQGRFDAMTKTNESLYQSCVKGRTSVFKMSPGIELYSDRGICEKEKNEAVANDKANLSSCQHSIDALVARYQSMISCYSVSKFKATSFNTVGYILSDAHLPKNNSCATYGRNTSLDASSGRCVCRNNYVWNTKNNACISDMYCPVGSIQSGGACVTLTKMCIEKYGVTSYAATTYGNSECRCGSNQTWNSDKTKCVNK